MIVCLSLDVNVSKPSMFATNKRIRKKIKFLYVYSEKALSSILSFTFKKKALSILQSFFYWEEEALISEIEPRAEITGNFREIILLYGCSFQSSNLFLDFALLKTYIPYFETFGASKQVHLLDLGVFGIRNTSQIPSET